MSQETAAPSKTTKAAKGKKRILTGDRPTGKLHLGHFVGTLQNRVRLQDEYDCHFIIADFQVLNDHLEETEKVEENVREILLDWLAVGMDPAKSVFFIQSQVPQLSELTQYLSYLVTVARLRRNPTIKTEAAAINVDSEKDNIVYGFLGYPVSQAADILLFLAHLVPVGEDQKPHIEQTAELARRFNHTFQREVFPVPEALIGKTARLPGLDGRKMSKSFGNAIQLADSEKEVQAKVMEAITDPARLRATDPGHPEVCNVFTYYKVFDPEYAPTVEDYCRGGKKGCVPCKKDLAARLNALLDPIRTRRAEFAADPAYVSKTIREGNERARAIGEQTMAEVRKAVKYDYKALLGE